MHHKIQTFEHVNKKLALVTQDKLLDYMTKEFNFGHLSNPPAVGDAMHFHAYRMAEQPDHSYRLTLQSRFSTDAEGIALCLGLQAEARVELEEIVRAYRPRFQRPHYSRLFKQFPFSAPIERDRPKSVTVSQRPHSYGFESPARDARK